MEKQKVWCNYGVILKLPLTDVEPLTDYFKKKGYKILYDSEPTLHYIKLIVDKAPPSGGANAR